MQRSLLDTDILSFYLKGDPVVVRRAEEYLAEFDRITFSIITYFEIHSGLLFRDARGLLRTFQRFADKSEIIVLDADSCNRSSELYAATRKRGVPVDDLDLLIAGIALEHEYVLVTNNDRHFSRIPDLKIENWKKP
jgi:tRNA(fMet)-specific endonuclease VapC